MSDRTDFPVGSTSDEDISELYNTFKKGGIGCTLHCPECDNLFEIEQKSGRIREVEDLKTVAIDTSDSTTGPISFILGLGKSLISNRVLQEDEFLIRGFKVDNYEGGESELKCQNCEYQCKVSEVDVDLNIVLGPDYDFEN